MASTIIKREEFKDHPLLNRLLELHDIPKQLYLRGTLPEVTFDIYGRATPRILTVVGSRKYTDYGKHALKKLLSLCKGEDIIILSGLALGVDGLAHREALAHGLKTIAIPGSGLDQKVLYPSSHRALAKEIIDSDGVLISELEDDTRPAPWTFPQRNRIMAALSDAVLIIEAEEKSGTLVTAKLALELGRDIGAVPGNIFSPTAGGTNLLIKNGAYPITNETDLFALLHLSMKNQEERSKDEDSTLTEHESLILALLPEPVEKDTLLLQTKLSFQDFLTAFSLLEIKGYIEESFGEVRKIV